MDIKITDEQQAELDQETVCHIRGYEEGYLIDKKAGKLVRDHGIITGEYTVVLSLYSCIIVLN